MQKNSPPPTALSTEPVVAYIIVSWNNKDILDECIESIFEQKNVQKHVLLVDNDSKDGTAEYITNTYPKVFVMAQEANHGFAKGNNIGIKEALKDPSVEFVVLLNSDARLADNWTETLARQARLKVRTATMQSITLDYYDHGIMDSTHVYLSTIGQATQGSFRQPIAFGSDVAPQKVFGCNAAAMLITRKFIEAQPFEDFFDETMFMYLEDVDVATRATVMGWDNYVVPGTRAYHMGSASSGKNPGFSLYMTFRNNLGLMIKNLPFPILMKVILMIPRSDRASIRHLKRIGKSEGVPAILKGRAASLLYIPIFLMKRHTLKKSRKVDTQYLWHLMRKGY